MQEIYSINYTGSIYQLGTQASTVADPAIIEIVMDYAFGLDGTLPVTKARLLYLPMLSSNVELCYSFNFQVLSLQNYLLH